MPFLALPQMVVYIFLCLIPFQCASAPGEKRKRKRGERGGKKKRGKKGEKEELEKYFFVSLPHFYYEG